MNDYLAVSLAYESLPDRIYQVLKESIARNEIPWGTRLVENEIASKLKVSRTPVREAISRLASEGLVTLVPRRGAFVASFTPQMIKDIYEVREALEVLAVELAVPRCTEADIQNLRHTMQAFETALDNDDYALYFEMDGKFHEQLAEISGNSKLQECLRMLDGSTKVTRWMHCQNRELSRVALEEHQNIIAALEKHDRDLSVQLISEHIKRVKFDLLESVGS